MSTALVLRQDRDLERYIAEVSRYPLLSRDEELALARAYKENNDIDAAHKLVVSNLRFVVKIAHQYRGYGLRLLDIIQEGNIGLMVAVKKFDPSKGYRLISYAVWWIRDRIHTFIMRSWSLVTEPTLVSRGLDDPFSRPAAWRSSTGVGGVLVMKVNDRSS